MATLPLQTEGLRTFHNFNIPLGFPQGSIRITFDDRYKIPNCKNTTEIDNCR